MADRAATITREEFIKDYTERCNAAGLRVTATSDGILVGKRRRVAVPCDCGEDICQGWAMLPEDDA